MAKFKVEVDLDWIEEGGEIDGEIRDSVTRQITNAIVEKLISKIQSEVQNEATKTVSERINGYFDELMDQKVEAMRFPYRKPGSRFSEQPEMLTIPEIFSLEMEIALNKTVDENGRTVERSSYGGKGTRIEWLTGKIAERMVDEKVQKFVGDFHKKINEYLSETLRKALMEQISSAMVSHVDLNKVFAPKE